MTHETGHNRILVVDDTPQNLRVLEVGLSRRGFTIFKAANGTEAIEMAQQLMPDLILLDVMMPDMSGYDVCKHLHTLPETTSIPIIFVSSLSDTIDKVYGLSIGGVDFITKPFDIEEVVARVQTHLTIVRQKHILERRIQEDAEYFIEMSKIKQDLINQMAHDTKNPISSIILSVHLMRRQTTVDEIGDKYLNRINDVAKQVIELVTNLLELAKLETKRLYIERVEITSFAEGVVSLFQSIAEDKSVTLQVSYQNVIAGTEWSFNRLQVQQALTNLLSNAMKFTPTEGQVSLLVTLENDMLHFTIADTGIGIPQSEMSALFTRFYRVNTAEHHQVEGTGLGLYIVKSIIEQHGGQIWVESESGKGSQFHVTLPRLTVD